MMKTANPIESLLSLSSEQLSGVTGGRAGLPIFENGGVVGPLGSATPRPSIFENGGVVGPLGSATPTPGRSLVVRIPESGGIVGPKGSPTPF